MRPEDFTTREGVKPEGHCGEREMIYSAFHRSLSAKCYAMDVDWIEWRRERGVVALIECKSGGGELRSFQRKILLDAARSMKVPAYYVRHNLPQAEVLTKENEDDVREECQFRVEDLINKTVEYMSLKEYSEFVEGL